MRLDFAKYTPWESSDNIRQEHRGAYDVFLLANGKNEPKEAKSISSKISKVLIESFLKRPALKDLAFEKLAEMANGAVISSQTPNYRIQCDYLFLAQKGNKVKWARNGDITLLHFADGNLVSRTEKNVPASLGAELGVLPEIYETEVLDSGDHYFVAFSGQLEEKLLPQNIERSVRGAEGADELLSDLLKQYAGNGGSEAVSVFTLHLPPRKKKIHWIILVPIILAVLFFIFGALGKMRPRM